ncbi:hypothetical protein JNN96_37680 [Mycobacterium sp. DSM 3803]|nr:hypothetical protein [Mycobacterium sp. DSM 3803]
MHQLTIELDDTTSTMPYSDFETAHQQLLSHVIAKDLYLHANSRNGEPGTSFQLVRVNGHPTRPRVVGTARIEPAPANPVATPYYSARAALDWIAERDAIWLQGCDTDSGVRYPLAVLTAARAEARRWVAAGTIYDEAAELAGIDNNQVPRPHHATLAILRDEIVTAAALRAQPLPAAALASEVQRILPAETTPQQTDALIWWSALLMWGATAR